MSFVGLCNKRTHLLLIPISIFRVVWKERNALSDRIERDFVSIRDRWIHMFEFLILGHDISGLNNFGNVIDHSIDM